MSGAGNAWPAGRPPGTGGAAPERSFCRKFRGKFEDFDTYLLLACWGLQVLVCRQLGRVVDLVLLHLDFRVIPVKGNGVQ